MHAGARGNAYSEDCHARREGRAVSIFCPDGYVPALEAMSRAAKYWFSDQIVALERATGSQSETKQDHSVDAAARAFSQPQVPDALQLEFHNIVNQTVHRLRNYLHRGNLKAYYFGHNGCHSVPPEFWATAEADGVMESGIYWPFGEPPRLFESRPNYPLLLRQSELDALLSEQAAKKRPLPKAKMPELVAALRKHDHLPNRTAQLQALCNMPEFREFKITSALFRQAARHVPRNAGRKSRRES
jgi:hypothetical protein